MLEFIARQAGGCTWVTSVCTGAFLLAQANLQPRHALTLLQNTLVRLN